MINNKQTIELDDVLKLKTYELWTDENTPNVKFRRVIDIEELKQLANQSQESTLNDSTLPDSELFTSKGNPDTNNNVCKCGHDWNFHNVLDKEACHEMDCKCNKFEPKEDNQKKLAKAMLDVFKQESSFNRSCTN